MMNEESKILISLQDYINKGKTFVVPDYQRGYVWGKSRIDKGDEKDSATYMIESLLSGFAADAQVFVQGVTVSEQHDKIEVIDGQQRTTFFYLLLKFLNYSNLPKLDYQVRKESGDFLKNIAQQADVVALSAEVSNECYQDVFFFKKTLRLFESMLESDHDWRKRFLNYVLTKVFFLYIDITLDKAQKVFKMMNGNRADMWCEDVLKAELLRLVSQDDDDDTDALKYEKDMLRSRYAREWDRWVYWWNRPEVKRFFKVDSQWHPLYPLFYVLYNRDDRCAQSFNFDSFKLKHLSDARNAKKTFYALRQTQKTFEDVFNDVDSKTHRHNTIGAIICALHKTGNVLDFVNDYFNERITKLDRFYRLTMMALGKGGGWLSYAQILNIMYSDGNLPNEQDAIATFMQAINSSDMYQSSVDQIGYKECAFRQLMLLNIEEDNRLGRAFNFDIDSSRSIEHILPQSKVYYRDASGVARRRSDDSEVIPDTSYIDEATFAQNCSQHCIGNLALLYCDNNSKFGNKSFDEKKDILFGLDDEGIHSRELLHTLSLFAHKTWGVNEIQNNKNYIINRLKDYYGIR